MAFLVGVILALVSALVVLWPFLRRRRPRSRPTPPEDLSALEARWNALLDEMVAVQTDADLGRIPPQEAEERVQALRLELARVLKALRERQGIPLPGAVPSSMAGGLSPPERGREQ
ncbi:hypothetical protein HRbin23_01586 [bacterium HR23]|nr:hypothetical protein HRbin23_01586 [bacterium HR23]